MRHENSVVRKNFAKRLKASRIAAGFETARDFARFVGLEESTYRMYERGDRSPAPGDLWTMADAVKQSIDFLIKGRVDAET